MQAGARVSLSPATRVSTKRLACVASIFVWFRSKERPRKGIFGFSRTRRKNEKGGVQGA